MDSNSESGIGKKFHIFIVQLESLVEFKSLKPGVSVFLDIHQETSKAKYVTQNAIISNYNTLEWKEPQYFIIDSVPALKEKKKKGVSRLSSKSKNKDEKRPNILKFRLLLKSTHLEVFYWKICLSDFECQCEYKIRRICHTKAANEPLLNLVIIDLDEYYRRGIEDPKLCYLNDELIGSKTFDGSQSGGKDTYSLSMSHEGNVNIRDSKRKSSYGQESTLSSSSHTDNNDNNRNRKNSREKDKKNKSKKNNKKDRDDDFSDDDYNNNSNNGLFSENSVITARNSDYLYKVIIVGDSGVGKSCLVKRWIFDDFKSTLCSLGVEEHIKSYDVKGETVSIQIWDTAGQEQFRSLTNRFYRGAHGVLVVYDVTNIHSFENITKWLQDIDSFATAEAPPKILLIANKIDAQNRTVSTQQGQILAQRQGLFFMEASAKTGRHVDSAIQILLQEIHKNQEIYGKNRHSPSSSVSTHSPRSKVIVDLSESNIQNKEKKEDEDDECTC